MKAIDAAPASYISGRSDDYKGIYEVPGATELLSLTEAAFAARVTRREVNRVIDENILPKTFVSLDNGRHVEACACSLICFYFGSAKHLAAEKRLDVIKRVEPKIVHFRMSGWMALLQADWIVRDWFLTIDLMPFVEATYERVVDLSAAREMVTASQEVLRGTPVIRATRVPVHDVAASVAAGYPTERILAAYPRLDTEQVRLAAIYAEANPPRGRPRVTVRLPEGSTLLSTRRVPRFARG